MVNVKEDSVKDLALLINKHVCLVFSSFKIALINGLNLQTVLFTRLQLSNQEVKRETLLCDFAQAI